MIRQVFQSGLHTPIIFAGDEDKAIGMFRLGLSAELAGLLAGTPDADRTVRYLTKYLTKAIAEPFRVARPNR